MFLFFIFFQPICKFSGRSDKLLAAGAKGLRTSTFWNTAIVFRIHSDYSTNPNPDRACWSCLTTSRIFTFKLYFFLWIGLKYTHVAKRHSLMIQVYLCSFLAMPLLTETDPWEPKKKCGCIQIWIRIRNQGIATSCACAWLIGTTKTAKDPSLHPSRDWIG